MLKIKDFSIDNLQEGCITDNLMPSFSFALESDRQSVALSVAKLTLNNWTKKFSGQVGLKYDGSRLEPFAKYTASVKAQDNYGEIAEAELMFETGRMGTAWQASWITDASYIFKEKKASPVPMLFRKDLCFAKKVKSAKAFVTALGIYEFDINGKKIGCDYFAPGFTSYKNQLQYQVYDITAELTESSCITAVVAGGWASGKFTHSLVNRAFVKRQAFLCEIRVVYEDGTRENFGTDQSWTVTTDSKFREADFYDGEVYDSTYEIPAASWKKCSIEKLRISPELIAAYGAPVRRIQTLTPISCKQTEEGLLYDFGQNFAGVINAEITGGRGQKITFKHAEILMDGKLFTKPLRTAKARAVYTCSGGEETYSPKLTFMGFRYVLVEGIKADAIKLTAFALSSNLTSIGTFECSNAMINQLQSNIVWSARSNFIDIPTDCPQRDERMGWTGDIALFSRTASFNFDTSRFFDKWLKDLRSDQKRTGGVPVTVPHVVFPSNLESVFTMAIDHWGDSCILVPWAEYLARGDKDILCKMYPSMKKYLKACKFWASLFSLGKYRYIWQMGHHYGDWCAPNIGLFAWMGRGKWTATACFANSAAIVAEIAKIIGNTEDYNYYSKLSAKIKKAYIDVFTDKQGKLKKEFQTAYVLPLYYNVFGSERQAAADNLAALVRANEYKIATGFPGTPFILFALADNGHKEEAFKMLLCESCPSWMHQVKTGGTTIWERWDALRQDGTSNTGATDGTHGMVSFNHYANGAVGDFFYRRIAGIEALAGGYKEFKIEPVVGGGITYAKASVQTPYGMISSSWKIEGGYFIIDIVVPPSTKCSLTLPDKTTTVLESGKYSLKSVI